MLTSLPTPQERAVVGQHGSRDLMQETPLTRNVRRLIRSMKSISRAPRDQDIRASILIIQALVKSFHGNLRSCLMYSHKLHSVTSTRFRLNILSTGQSPMCHPAAHWLGHVCAVSTFLKSQLRFVQFLNQFSILLTEQV